VPGFPCLTFESDALPESQRFRAFAGTMSNFNFIQRRPGPFRAQAQAWRIGDIVLCTFSVTALRYEQTQAMADRIAADHFYINMHLSGEVVADCGGGTLGGSADSLLVIYLRQSAVIDPSPEAALSLAIPRRLLLPRLQEFGLMPSGGLVPILMRSVQAVADSLPNLDQTHATTLETMLADLAGAVLVDALRRAELGSSLDPVLAVEVRRFLQAN